MCCDLTSDAAIRLAEAARRIDMTTFAGRRTMLKCCVCHAVRPDGQAYCPGCGITTAFRESFGPTSPDGILAYYGTATDNFAGIIGARRRRRAATDPRPPAPWWVASVEISLILAVCVVPLLILRAILLFAEGR